MKSRSRFTSGDSRWVHNNMKNTSGKTTTAQQKEGALRLLIDELKQDPKIEAAFIFGSFARETTSPDSDIDLLVITKEYFHKEILNRKNVEFEIFYNNKEDTLIFWKENSDDFVNFIRDAKLIFGNKDTIDFLEQGASNISNDFKHFKSF